jgi:putative hydroxymethylpyrimidine transport system substrate-binding protein
VTRTRRPLVAAALALTAVLALAACGERKEPLGAPGRQSLTLLLDYFPNADHAGIYAAQARGDFARAGLNVKVQAPTDPAGPLKLLQAGRVDLAISYEPELLLARDKGAQLVSVGAIVQKPLTAIVSLRSAHIRSPSDLEGKTVGTAGIAYQSAYLKQIAQDAGIDPHRVKEVDVGFNLVPAMLSKRVDATLGAFWNYEGVQLRLKHKRPSIIRMESAGVPTYDELIVVARKDTVEHRGATVRRFMQALADGYGALRSDPAVGIDPLLAANHDLDRRLQEASVRATLPVFFPAASTGKPFGWQDPRAWNAYGDWMFQNHLLKRQPNAAAAMTDEFLPGQGA